MDVVARMHGGGVSAQAGALRHGISPRAARGRPEPARRAQAPRLPDARRARQGAQEGRPQEGPQAAAVLQALARERGGAPSACADARASCSAPTASAASPASCSPPSSRSALGRAATTVARDRGAARPRVLVIRDTRESGEMLEAALAAGVAAAGGDVLLGGVLPTPGRAAAARPLRLRPRGGHLARRTTRTATTASSSSAPTASSSPTRPRPRSRRRLDERAARRRRRPRSAASARCTARRRTTCASCTTRFADLDLAGVDVAARLRQRRDATASRPRSSAASARP